MKFKIHTEYIQLIQLLKAVNLVESGGQAKHLVEDGLVSLNGEQEFRKRAKLRPGDIVQIEDIIIEIESENEEIL